MVGTDGRNVLTTQVCLFDDESGRTEYIMAQLKLLASHLEESVNLV